MSIIYSFLKQRVYYTKKWNEYQILVATVCIDMWVYVHSELIDWDKISNFVKSSMNGIIRLDNIENAKMRERLNKKGTLGFGNDLLQVCIMQTEAQIFRFDNPFSSKELVEMVIDQADNIGKNMKRSLLTFKRYLNDSSWNEYINLFLSDDSFVKYIESLTLA